MSVKRGSRARTAVFCAAAACAMLGMGFASVPLYRMFCQVTGYGGQTRVAVAPSTHILDRSITVRLDANIEPGMALVFKPEQISREVRLGETSIAFYTLTNTSQMPISAVASYNVAPHKLGVYFQKLECFCFDVQTLAPGETRQLPVIYYVDPAMADDWDTLEVPGVTLSYTFHPAKAEQSAKLEEKRKGSPPTLGARPDAG